MTLRTALAVAALLGLGGCIPGGKEPPGTGERPGSRGEAVPASADAGPEEPATLLLPAPGESVQRRLAEGPGDVFAVPAAGGELLRAVVWEQGADVALRLLAPSGAVVAEADHPGTRPGAVLLDALLDEAGEHRLEVTRAAPGFRSQLYRLRVEAFRPATEEDRAGAPARRQAQQLLHRALTLMLENREERTREAIALCERALPLWREGGAPFGAAWTLHGQGVLLKGLGENAAADVAFQGAVDTWRRIGDRIGEAWSSLHWTELMRQGDSERCRRLLEESLDIFRDLGDSLGEASALNELGLVARRRGDEETVELFRRSLVIREAEGDGYGQAETLFNLGATWWLRGEPRQALTTYEAAREKLGPVPDSTILSGVLLGEAMAFQRVGELQEALDRFSQARPLVLQSGNKSHLASLLLSLAALYHHLGDFDEALEAYREVLELSKGMGASSRVMTTLGYMAWLQSHRGEPEEALALFEEALRLGDEAGATADLRSRAYALFGRGSVRAQLGHEKAGVEDLHAALAIWRQLGNRVAEADTLSRLGLVQSQIGDLDTAEKLLVRAREISAAAGDGLLEAATLERLSTVSRFQGDLESAQAELEAALEIIESERRTLLREDYRTSVFASWQPTFERYVDLLLIRNAREPSRGFDADALRASERARARGLVELLAEARIDLGEGVDPELKKREEALADQVTTLQQEMLWTASQSGTAAGALRTLRERLRRLRDQQATLEAELRRAAPRYAELVYPEPLTLEQVQELLDEGTVLLEYLLSDEGARLFVVTRRALTTHTLPASSAEIEERVGRLRRSIERRTPGSESAYVRIAHELYEILVAPAADELADKSHLLIAPDGELYHLPFETLLTEQPVDAAVDFGALPYLLRRVAVSYVPSATVLASLDGQPTEHTAGDLELVAFADPAYGGGDGAGAREVAGKSTLMRGDDPSEGAHLFPRLTASRREAEAIARLFPPGRVELRLGSAASETAVKSDPLVHEARLLHFAVHGIVDEEVPANSGLVLSLGEPSEDGFLQLREVFDLDLDADLVVLSACDTGRGKALRGEGLVGLARGFFYAGARTLLVSLWKVEDEATADLMVRFYGELVQSGLGASEALRQAKLATIQEPGSSPHPSTWAPFLVLGKRR